MNNRRMWLKGLGLVAMVAGLIYLTAKYAVPLTRFVSNANQMGDYLASFGMWGAAVFVLLQAVQVIIAPIPGEVTQFAGGFIYGTLPGTLFSVLGILLGSAVVFGLGRWFGLPLLKLVIPDATFKKFEFLLNHPKTELVILILFLIPGSPKDVLTYIAGLTPVKPLHFFIASMVARFPGILLSSYIGAHVETKAYGPVIGASILALGLFVLGVLMQERIMRLFHVKKGKIKMMKRWQHLPQWGDLGNGTYKNPILMADYSDPDLCQVGKDFYMVCSEFHLMGIPVLHSRDLVNWTLIGRVYDRMDVDPAYNTFERYGNGCWAPSIRYQAGRYYVYFCTPDEGLFMATAEKPEGPWSPLHCVQRVPRWEDPCPFWDDDGQAYLGHSVYGAGPIIIHKMSPDGRQLLDEGRTVYEGPVAEGTKFLKRNGYYYLLIPEGGVEMGWQTALRAKNIYGPYERKIVLETGSTKINGPHQGGLVELENGEAWFIHFQSVGALGRVAHLQPVRWVDDWPVMGTLNEGRYEPVDVFKKPDVGEAYPICAPQSGDEFASDQLGFQWAWNHNPLRENWSLTERKGWLRLKSAKAPELLKAYNTLTQKLMGPEGVVTIKLDPRGLVEGQVAGLCQMGGTWGWIGVERVAAGLRVKVNLQGNVAADKLVAATDSLGLRMTLDRHEVAHFSFSIDEKFFEDLPGESPLKFGYWKGAKLGLFTYHTGDKAGVADFDWFHYDYAGPKA